MSTVTEEIRALEREILEKKSRLADLRRSQPAQPVEDHVFQGPEGPVRLSELFGDKSDLVLISNMGRECAYCTLWADGFNGFVPELESRAGFALMSADPIEVLRPFAQERGWRFPWVSGDLPTRRALRTVDKDDDPGPIAIGLHKDENGSIFEISRSFLGEGDDFCSVWHLFNLLKDGWNGWEPNYRL